MSELDAICRALLVAVMAAAASSKLGGRALGELAATLAGFGVPVPLRRPLALAVLAGEVATVVLLLAAPAAGYTLALALLVAFTAGIVRALRTGAQVGCRCFGASATPIGRSHVVRNTLLIAAGGLGLAAAGQATLAAWPLMLLGGILGAAITRWEDLAFVFGGHITRPPSTSIARPLK